MGVEIEIAKDDAESWDAIVKAGGGTIFHTWEWLECVEECMRMRLYPLKAYVGNDLLCILPLFVCRRFGLKMAFSPPPRGLFLYMGPVFVKEYKNLHKFGNVFGDFVGSLNDFVESELGCDFIRIRTHPSLHYVVPLMWNGYTMTPYFTFYVNLRENLDQIWANLDKKTRNNIRKSKKEGCYVEFGEWNDLDTLRKMLAGRLTAQGMRITKDYYKEYLFNLYKRLYPEKLKIFAAKINGETVGGFVGLPSGNSFLLWIGIPRVELKGVYPNDLAIWEGIKWAKENGYEYFEKMDAGNNVRLSRYKSQFNPEPKVWFSAVKFFGIGGRVTTLVKKIFKWG